MVKPADERSASWPYSSFIRDGYPLISRIVPARASGAFRCSSRWFRLSPLCRDTLRSECAYPSIPPRGTGSADLEFPGGSSVGSRRFRCDERMRPFLSRIICLSCRNTSGENMASGAGFSENATFGAKEKTGRGFHPFPAKSPEDGTVTSERNGFREACRETAPWRGRSRSDFPRSRSRALRCP